MNENAIKQLLATVTRLEHEVFASRVTSALALACISRMRETGLDDLRADVHRRIVATIKGLNPDAESRRGMLQSIAEIFALAAQLRDGHRSQTP